MGSCVKRQGKLGKAKPFSDLDPAVIGEMPLPLAMRVALIEALDEADLPISIDVVDWAQTSERFREIRVLFIGAYQKPL